MTQIVVSIITGVFTLAGVIVTVVVGGRQQTQKMLAEAAKAQAVTDTKLDELTREVREHNNFAKRMPVVEEQIKVINRQIDGLERRKEDQ